MRTFILLVFFAGLNLRGADVEVTLYNAAGVSRNIIDSSMTRLEAILQTGGLGLHWVEGPPASIFTIENVAEVTGPASVEQRCRALRAIHARIIGAPPPGNLRSALGYSIPLSSYGINVTIFATTVRAMADRTSLAPQVIIAHALAHELGHVLLRSIAHTQHGLMSAAWDAAEVDVMHRTELRFNATQIDLMEKTLAGEGCSEAPQLHIASDTGLAVRRKVGDLVVKPAASGGSSP